MDTAREATLSLDVADQEVRSILQSLKANPLSYRRVILKGTFAVPNRDASLETVVVRAVYMRSTLKAIEFDPFDPGVGRTILDLADELRLAVVLGGYGIPSEPAAATTPP